MLKTTMCFNPCFPCPTFDRRPSYGGEINPINLRPDETYDSVKGYTEQ